MADALDPVGRIHEGLWLDWSRERVWGQTLTLGPTGAILLTNLLAIWVTFCSLQLWTILRFVLHHKVASVQPEAMTPHLNGQRIILRNGGSAFATAHLMFDLAWNGRRSTGRRSKRAYAIVLLAVTYAGLFAVSGAFSNKMISAAMDNGDSRVLLRNDHCGVWNQTFLDIVVGGAYSTEKEFEAAIQYNSQKAQEVQMSLEYAQECYLSQMATTNDKPSTCHTLKQSSLSWATSNTTKCPYATPLCRSSPETMKLDTSYIDSHDHLGINASPEERIKYRRVTNCTVLSSEFSSEGWDGSIVNASSPRPSPQAARAFYGKSLTEDTEWTYSYSNFASFYDNFTVQVTSPYQLGVAQAMAPSNPAWINSDFLPIPELALENADLNLIFLSYTGMYLGPVSDPWFSANRKHDFDSPLPFLRERYERDDAISTMSCTEQHEFCTSRNDCTGLLGFNQVQNVQWFNDILSPNENATFDRILRGVADSRLWYVTQVLQLTTTPVLASMKSFDGKSGATISSVLPEDQWQRELEFWHAISMAQLQRTVARWATGQIVPKPEYLQNATDSQDVWFCKSLIVPSAAYQSFTAVAILLVIVFGLMIILGGLFIKPIAAWVQVCLSKSTTKRFWEHDDIMELGRRTTRKFKSQSKLNNCNNEPPTVQSPSPVWMTNARPQNVLPYYNSMTSPQVQQTPRFHPGARRVASSSHLFPNNYPSSAGHRGNSWIPISLCDSDTGASNVPPDMRRNIEADKSSYRMPPTARATTSCKHVHSAAAGKPTSNQGFDFF